MFLLIFIVGIMVEELKYLTSYVRSLFRWPTIFSRSFCHLYFDESILHSEGVQSHLKCLKIWGGSESPSQNYFKLCKMLHLIKLTKNLIMIHGGHWVMELYKHLNVKLRVLLMSCTVAARIFYARKITIISSPMSGHLFDIIILALLINSCSTDPSKYMHSCWKSVGNCCQPP